MATFLGPLVNWPEHTRSGMDEMDEGSLRHLEKQFRLRVKTGCGTCRYVNMLLEEDDEEESGGRGKHVEEEERFYIGC